MHSEVRRRYRTATPLYPLFIATFGAKRKAQLQALDNAGRAVTTRAVRRVQARYLPGMMYSTIVLLTIRASSKVRCPQGVDQHAQRGEGRETRRIRPCTAREVRRVGKASAIKETIWIRRGKYGVNFDVTRKRLSWFPISQWP